MTRRDEIASQHEPFGDAFYFGPECMSPRFKDDPARRAASGVSDATYKSTLDGFEEVSKQVRFFPSAGFDSFFFSFPSCGGGDFEQTGQKKLCLVWTGG